MVGFFWCCPFCNHDTTIRDDTYSEVIHVIKGSEKGSKRACLKTIQVLCPNPECLRYTLRAELWTEVWNEAFWKQKVLIRKWSLIPQSSAKPFPNYIPKIILDDYTEACLIKDLSPKASATLSRRCLQGMIRDFWRIKKNTLKEEIDALKGKVEAQIWQAIESVRTVGNIGAHMEEDINLIIDVEPNEAASLIKLIEVLLKDWYIARHERDVNLDEVVKVAKLKQGERKKGKSNKEGKESK